MRYIRSSIFSAVRLTLTALSDSRRAVAPWAESELRVRHQCLHSDRRRRMEAQRVARRRRAHGALAVAVAHPRLRGELKSRGHCRGSCGAGGAGAVVELDVGGACCEEHETANINLLPADQGHQLCRA